MPTFGGIVIATGTESEGRRTLRDVVDELARPVNADDSTVRALAGDAFRAAVRTMNRRGLWPWELQQQDINIVSTNQFSSVTGSIKKPLSMYYLSQATGNPYIKMWYIPYDRFVEKYSLNVNGQPYAYTIANLFETGQVRWFPIPGANYTVRFDYYRNTPAPQTEDEVIEIPDQAMETYMAFAWYEFIKRTPSAKLVMTAAEALQAASLAFRQLSAFIATPGDRTREVNVDLNGTWM